MTARTFVATVIALLWAAGARGDPWDGVDKKPAPTNHSHLFTQSEFPDGPSVTRACLTCHPQAAQDLMQSSHWLWLGKEQKIPGHDQTHRIGKKNLLNNFCISIESNWPKCTSCHAGYGWKDASFDFSQEEHVDCLVCHDRSGGYAKGASGWPAAGTDLMAAAKSVGLPTRENCGACHFFGGGGNAVKHGDLDSSLSHPSAAIDVHMGGHDFQCIDCHRTKQHQISGRMMSTSVTDILEIACTDCHAGAPHDSDRLNAHTDAVACQACHLPETARKHATKMAWDWSTAGQDIEGADKHEYMKIKGSFLYQRKMVPEYFWFNGNSQRYLKGDRMDPGSVTYINHPLGDITEAQAKIWPFKIHRAKQPYDVKYRTLLVPKTVGAGGYWTEFDWQQAAKLGGNASGLAFSGELGFAETHMFWPQNHMVAPKERALQCTACHGEGGRLDWISLGYEGDPARSGGRKVRRLLSQPEERKQ